MNTSQSEELQYFVFDYRSIFKKKQAQNGNQFPSVFERNYRLRLLEIVFQGVKISKFSGGAYTQVILVDSRFDKVLGLDIQQSTLEFSLPH